MIFNATPPPDIGQISKAKEIFLDQEKSVKAFEISQVLFRDTNFEKNNPVSKKIEELFNSLDMAENIEYTTHNEVKRFYILFDQDLYLVEERLNPASSNPRYQLEGIRLDDNSTININEGIIQKINNAIPELIYSNKFLKEVDKQTRVEILELGRIYSLPQV